jgi:hypothetical protein
VGVIDKIKTRVGPWGVGWAIGAIIFAVVVTWQNRGLTFFWDEWDVVSATLESPYYGVLQDNGGNFFPLSRIVFGIELAIFGTWYPGYMLVTSLLFGGTAFAFNLLLDDGTKIRRIALSAFAVIYLSSTGVLFASSMGFMLKWGLSPLLAIISATFFLRSQEEGRNRTKLLVLGSLFFILSWASFSSSIILMALLIVGLIHFAPQGPDRSFSTSLHIKLSIAILSASAVLAIAGIRIAALNPPTNPLIGSAQGVFDSILLQNPLDSILLALAATLAGLASVLIAAPLHSNDFNSWLIIAFRDYLGFVVGILFIILGAVYAFKKSLPNRQLILLFGLLFTAMAFLTLARTPFIHRYQSLWIPIAILVILSAFSWLSYLNLALIRNLVLGIVIAAAVLSGWHIGTSSLGMATIERPRDVANSSTLGNPEECLNEASRTLEQIAPTITAQRLCSILSALNQRAWILERQDLR